MIYDYTYIDIDKYCYEKYYDKIYDHPPIIVLYKIISIYLYIFAQIKVKPKYYWLYDDF